MSFKEILLGLSFFIEKIYISCFCFVLFNVCLNSLGTCMSGLFGFLVWAQLLCFQNQLPSFVDYGD